MKVRKGGPEYSQRVRPHPQVVFTELSDGTGVLLHLTTKFFFSLNPTSTFLWKRLLRGGATRDSLVRHLLQDYRVSKAKALQDVGRFVSFLQREELLVSSGQG